MPAYDSHSFRPPAPTALVTVRSAAGGPSVSEIPVLLDTGADVSLLPRERLAELLNANEPQKLYELEAFDGTRSSATAVELELIFVGKSFRGQFLVIDGGYGILGRNILNSVSLVFDGPALDWREQRPTS